MTASSPARQYFPIPRPPKFPSRLMGLSGDRWSSAKLVKLDICFAEARRRVRGVAIMFSSSLFLPPLFLSLSLALASRDIQNEKPASRRPIVRPPCLTPRVLLYSRRFSAPTTMPTSALASAPSIDLAEGTQLLLRNLAIFLAVTATSY